MRRMILIRAVVASLVLAGLGGTALAQAPVEQAIENHLQAGEFAPAIALAQRAPAAQADRFLAQIALAQSRAGMRRSALDTARSITDDVALSDTLRGVGGQPVGNFGGAGGAGEPDFDAIIDLIKTTVAVDSWDDAGGPGSIAEFEGGVRVDANGLVHSLLEEDRSGELAVLRRRSAGQVGEDADVRRNSLLRKVSLPRLERAVQLKLAAGEPLDEEMRLLAGLQDLQYVLVYPETGDLVIAGPAGDWRVDAEGRLVGTESNRPVMRLDDLVVVLRHMTGQPDKPFGCSIVPLKENLARTKAFLAESAKQPLKPGQRGRWLVQLRDSMGQQAIEFYGIDPRTRVARVLFEADYRMKLVGIGAEQGTLGVPSYLQSVHVRRGEAPPPMGVLRWWFTLNYDAIRASEDRDAFELRGQGVKVLSENEMIADSGARIHTGKSDALTALFAQRFTKEFPALAAKYPVYAELQNICDMALACALVHSEDLAAQAGWQMTLFGDPKRYEIATGFAPERVETVMNHRVINRVHILAAASGGVRVDAAKLVQPTAIQQDAGGSLSSKRQLQLPGDLPRDRWWWD